jgi:very-short-patch-repair endonuclease
MILFHSATLNDLNPSCLRHALLKYCQNPAVEPSPVGDFAVSEIRSLAGSSDRALVPTPEPFESWFEVDVFLKLVDRGYRVIPQHEVAGYRIDLVVEGMTGRLAVECDGDHWHGPERYEQDMGRQRDLERCGWIFWRLRGSAFALDSEAALRPLWEMLGRSGIHSGGEPPPSSIMPGPGPARSVERLDPPLVLRREARLPLHEKVDISPEPPDGNDVDEDESVDQEAEEPPSSAGADPRLIDGTYSEWKGSALPDPTVAPPSQLIAALVEIVRAEGPLPAHRACQIYVKAAGRQRVGKQLKKVLYSALRKALATAVLEGRTEEKDSGLATQIVRAKGVPSVVVRPRGPRRFQEIPPSEIATVMARLEKLGGTGSATDLYRAVLAFYDTRRQTAQIEARLRWVDEHRAQLIRGDQGPPSLTSRLM